MKSQATQAAPLTLWRVIRWAWAYALGRWRGLIIVLAAMLLRIGLDVLKPWPMKVLVDQALQHKPAGPMVSHWMARLGLSMEGGKPSASLAAWCVGGTVVVFLLGWILATISSQANVTFSQQLRYDLATRLFEHLQRLSLRFHGRRPLGDTIRRVTGDSGCVGAIVKDGILPVVSSIISLAVMFGILWSLNWKLTLAALVVVPWMIWMLRRYAQPMMQRGYEQQEIEGRMYGLIEQMLSAMPIVQAFAREEANQAQFRTAASRSVNAAVATIRVQVVFKVMIGLATAVGTALIFWLGGQQALDGKLTVGGILVFLSYLSSLYGPLETLAYTSSTLQGAIGSVRRVREVLDSQPDVREHPHARPLKLARGEVRIEEVHFGYEAERPVLTGVNLLARPGEVIALVGPTGAGKTTLAALVPRFFDPWQGRVLLDGQDLTQLKLADVRAAVAVVPQDPFLFPQSIGQNIAYGRPGASQAEIEAAARAANAHEFIVQLPEGYQTVVGERGATLSGGQRQRLSIARALLKDSPVLVLDEPTAALDAESEHLVMEALGRLMANRTVLMIAHRLSTVRRADRIVVIEKGRIAEEGTHDQLMSANGLYASLNRMQGSL